MWKFIRRLCALVTALFSLSFIVYFFNLDMKLTSKIYPFLQKHYDRIERDKHL